MAVIDTSLRKESRDRYLTYALSVVSGRALPDVRDGLKPVQRRILYAMFHNLNLKPTGSHKKSAAVVGEVLAKFHPHGDIACYEAMVRMAQDFSYRYPLVEGQGNFGSLDGDSPAAYRYTEAKLAPIALEVLGEIHEETVDFKDNFDASTVEPEVLPSKIPNLLCNGATGIAVGLATNIPPHNLGDVVKALIALSNDPSLTIAKLAGILKGPDFPTGCEIVNSQAELSEMYQSGRGVVRMRGEWSVEEGNRGKRAIIVTSIPYALNKSMLVERIAQLIIDKKVPQLQDVRDESTDQVRVVIELATGADPDVAMAYVFKHTPLESNFNVNLTALVPTDAGSCRPQLLSLKEMLQYFLEFRYEVVERRLQFERKNLLERIHILEGFVKIFDKLDEAIKIVRASKGRSDAAGKLAKRFKLTEIQSYAIVDMRIYQLSQTNIKELRDELKEKKARVAEIDKILKSKKRIEGLVRGDLEKVAADYSDRRRCKIVKSVEEIELNEADYVVEEEVFAIVTSDGWLKKVRQTNELGSTRLREGDSILQAHPLTTLDSVAFFTNLGTLYVLRVSDFPSSSGYGSPIQKLLKFRDGEKVIESFGIRRSENAQQSLDGGEYGHLVDDGSKLVMVTQNGIGFAIELESLETIKRNGKRVMKLRAKDTVAAVCHLDKTISFFTQSGSGLAVSMKEIPVRAQAAVGVALMGVRDKDKIVSAVGYARKTSLNVLLGTGKTKSIQSSTVTSGRRGLKGTKVVSRGEIVRVERG